MNINEAIPVLYMYIGWICCRFYCLRPYQPENAPYARERIVREQPAAERAERAWRRKKKVFVRLKNVAKQLKVSEEIKSSCPPAAFRCAGVFVTNIKRTDKMDTTTARDMDAESRVPDKEGWMALKRPTSAARQFGAKRREDERREGEEGERGEPRGGREDAEMQRGGEGGTDMTATERGTQKEEIKKERVVNVDLEGEEKISMLELLKAVDSTCGRVIACRAKGPRRWELTMGSERGKERLLDGFKIRDCSVLASEAMRDSRVVSFLNLPAYITDEEICRKLGSWGVLPVSPIKKKKWPGTDVYDGTRFVKVKFTQTVSSLPYSTKFDTLEGTEYFRVIHDNQQRVCRLCLQTGHVLRDCPDFRCFKCGGVGHYARECRAGTERRQSTEVAEGDTGSEMDVREGEEGDAAAPTAAEQTEDEHVEKAEVCAAQPEKQVAAVTVPAVKQPAAAAAAAADGAKIFGPWQQKPGLVSELGHPGVLQPPGLSEGGRGDKPPRIAHDKARRRQGSQARGRHGGAEEEEKEEERTEVGERGRAMVRKGSGDRSRSRDGDRHNTSP